MHLDYMLGNATTGHTGLIRSYLDEPVAEASDWTNNELLMYLNQEHRHLFSVVRNFNEDWFGRVHVFPFSSSVYEYYLPMDCVTPRRVEAINASSVSGLSPNYVVNEETAGPREIDPISLNEKSSARRLTSTTNFFFGSGYYLYDDKIVFEPNGSINTTLYGRIYYTPQAPDLHRGTAQAGGASSITLSVSGSQTLLGDVKTIDNYYQGMRIEIISGTGSGQLRRIASYVGSTKVATVDSAWTTQPDGTSVYSIVSPIQEDYQELLVLGAAMRAKGIKIEDDTTGIGAVYSALRTDLDSALESRNHQTSRKVFSSARRSAWF